MISSVVGEKGTKCSSPTPGKDPPVPASLSPQSPWQSDFRSQRHGVVINLRPGPGGSGSLERVKVRKGACLERGLARAVLGPRRMSKILREELAGRASGFLGRNAFVGVCGKSGFGVPTSLGRGRDLCRAP